MNVTPQDRVLYEPNRDDPFERYPGYERGRLKAAVEALMLYYPPEKPVYTLRLPVDEFLEASDLLLELHPSAWKDFLRFSRYSAWLREYGPESLELLAFLAPVQSVCEEDTKARLSEITKRLDALSNSEVAA